MKIVIHSVFFLCAKDICQLWSLVYTNIIYHNNTSCNIYWPDTRILKSFSKTKRLLHTYRRFMNIFVFAELFLYEKYQYSLSFFFYTTYTGNAMV